MGDPPLKSPRLPRGRGAAVAKRPKPRIEAPTRALPATAEVLDLRLAIGQEGLALELERPHSLGPVSVVDLAASLPNVRFPVDVSGGVSRFRNRRGRLERAGFELDVRELAAWAGPELRGLLTPRSPSVWVSPHAAGATLAIACGGAVLAFELVVSAVDDDLRFVVTGGRGLGLPAPAMTLAIQAATALLAPVAERRGALFIVHGVTAAAARYLFPLAGARAPSVAAVRIASIAALGTTWVVRAAREAVTPLASDAWLRASEGARLTERADDALVAGDAEGARALLLGVLERAPRLPEAMSRLAQIDAATGARDETALATLKGRPSDPFDVLLRAELFARTGDAAGARAAFIRAAESESAPLLSARAYVAAAALTVDLVDALTCLDHAVARAPSLAAAHEARLGVLARLARDREAQGEVEALEALGGSPDEKRGALLGAAELLATAGMRGAATAAYERALRYAPDDPGALLGLAELFAARGATSRAAALLASALEGGDGAIRDRALLLLARLLAENLGDSPAAIGRLREVDPRGEVALRAHALEGRYRAELGDLTGARAAYARLREGSSARATAEEGLIDGLLEAARFEREKARDRRAEAAHLAEALRLAPGDARVRALYRGAGEAAFLVERESTDIEPTDVESSVEPAIEPTDIEPTDIEPTDIEPTDIEPPGEAPPDPEARVEELSRILQLDPSRDDVVDELSRHLLALGRSHELFALLSARLEEASPARRRALLPKQREALALMRDDAQARGNSLEAGLFASALDALEA